MRLVQAKCMNHFGFEEEEAAGPLLVKVPIFCSPSKSARLAASPRPFALDTGLDGECDERSLGGIIEMGKPLEQLLAG